MISATCRDCSTVECHAHYVGAPPPRRNAQRSAVVDGVMFLGAVALILFLSPAFIAVDLYDGWKAWRRQGRAA